MTIIKCYKCKYWEQLEDTNKIGICINRRIKSVPGAYLTPETGLGIRSHNSCMGCTTYTGLDFGCILAESKE